ISATASIKSSQRRSAVRLTSKPFADLLVCSASTAAGDWPISNLSCVPLTPPPAPDSKQTTNWKATTEVAHERVTSQHHRSRGPDQPRSILRVLRPARIG